MGAASDGSKQDEDREHGSSSSVLAALGANLAVAIAKFVAFAFTGSAAMMAEGIHSVADTSNQLLLLFGGRRSRRHATADHPFGFGQEAYFSAFLVAVVLFTLGAAFSLFEGYRKLTEPHEVESFGWAIGVLVFAMAAESVALRRATKEASKTRSGSWWSYIRTTREPEKAVVILEDSAAEVGLLAALLGIVMTAITGDARYDALGTLVIAAVLAVVAVVLAREMRSLLLAESAGSADLDAICGVLDSHPAVERTVDLRTMHLGPDDVLVAARLEFRGSLELEEAADHIADITEALRDAVEHRLRVYIEPG